MLPVQLTEADEALLTRVCIERWPESMTLEFKRDLLGGSDKDKAELCKDVAAMANADGGDIIFGIDEDNGVASALAPIAAEPSDSAKRRLGQILAANIEPRINGLHLQEIAINGGYALLVRVPASFDGPHRFNNRFVSRTGTHTVDLTYDQLRNAFGRGATLEASAKAFIAERRAALRRGETWANRAGLPTCMAHLVPLSCFTGRSRPDIYAVEQRYDDLRFSEWTSVNRWLNLDGVLVFPGGPDTRVTYTQAFRNGAFEAVRYADALHTPQPGQRLIWARLITKYFREALLTLTRAAKAQGASGPAVFSISLHEVRGYTWYVSQYYNLNSNPVADRDDLLLPDVWIENVADISDPDALIRPLLDVLWQAFGVSGRCPEFNAEGKWEPQPQS